MEEARILERDRKDKGKIEAAESGKRKFDGSSGSGSKKKTGRWDSKKSGGQSSGKYCETCKSKHNGQCSSKTRRCNKCGKIGHDVADCRNPPLCYNCGESGHISTACTKERKTGPSCYTCGERGHVSRDCPKNKGGKKNGAKGRAFVMTADEAKDADDVIAGTFLVNSIPAFVLFDTGANRSFVSHAFCVKFCMPRSLLSVPLDVDTPSGHVVSIREYFDGCSILICDKSFSINLLPMGICGFDIVVGMDWMSTYGAEIDCAKKLVRIPVSGGGYVTARGDRNFDGSSLISLMRARRCISKGGSAFLKYVIDAKKQGVDIDDVDVVRDFSDVFSDDLLGIPPERHV